AIADAKAQIKGNEKRAADMLGKGVADGKTQDQLEAEWLKWAEEKEGRSLDAGQDATAEQAEGRDEEPASQEFAVEQEQADATPENITPDAELTSIFTGLSSRGLAKTRAQKAAESHPRSQQIAYVQENFLDILSELEDAGLVKINCD
ncbi:MAG: hypothetical protein ACRCTX_10120, partial [Afipia sp.]